MAVRPNIAVRLSPHMSSVLLSTLLYKRASITQLAAQTHWESCTADKSQSAMDDGTQYEAPKLLSHTHTHMPLVIVWQIMLILQPRSQQNCLLVQGWCVSVTWNVLSWAGGHEFEPRSGRTWGAWYFCPKSYLNQVISIASGLTLKC